jgi:dihydropteroate synthase
VVSDWAQAKILRAKEGGIGNRIIIDPGIGFGKTAEQSWALINRIAELKKLDVPLLVGHSRKSFLSRVTDAGAGQRDSATVLVSSYLAAKKVNYLRVHDIAGHAVMLRIREALA